VAFADLRYEMASLIATDDGAHWRSCPLVMAAAFDCWTDTPTWINWTKHPPAASHLGVHAEHGGASRVVDQLENLRAAHPPLSVKLRRTTGEDD